MISSVNNVCVFVKDQEKAKEFYINTFGFELRTDMPMGPDGRWISVAPKGAATEIVLYAMDQNWQHYKVIMGKSQALTLNVQNMEATIADLRAKGVKITMEPNIQPWGKQAIIEDCEGNGFVLFEAVR